MTWMKTTMFKFSLLMQKYFDLEVSCEDFMSWNKGLFFKYVKADYVTKSFWCSHHHNLPTCLSQLSQYQCGNLRASNLES